MTRPLRALVVAYDFPPHGAIGTMRTLRLVQQLVENNWEVKVLTSDPRAFRSGTPLDEPLLARVPSSATVVRAAPFRGFDWLKDLARKRLARGAAADSSGTVRRAPKQRRSSRRIAGGALDLIDAALAIPDHESGWLVPAVAKGLWACRGWRPDVLYSSAPPWTGQVVARGLAAILRCPWVADFRDPWSRAPWREARRNFVKRANGVLERLVVRRADALLFVTRGNLDEFSTFYGPGVSHRFHLIPNGCDPTEFEDIGAAPACDRFVLLHAGTLYGARNPMPLVQAIARAINRGAIGRERFRLRLLGPINLNVDVSAECKRLGISDVVELIPRVSRRESLHEMAAASALLLVQPGTTVSIPGKAYEYLAAGRPLIALAEEGETADLVRASGIGVSVRPEADVTEMEAALLAVMDIASRAYTRPAIGLYDGYAHADVAVQMMQRIARGERLEGPKQGVATHPAPAAPVELEEPGR